MSTQSDANIEAARAIKFGMEAEKRGLESYLDYARNTQDETGKNMFILLARDELSHFEILEKALSDIELSGRWSEVQIQGSLIERIMPRLHERAVRTQGASGVDQVSALEAAMEQERKAAELYREQLEKTTDPVARKVFKRLVAMEEAHYDLLSAELDSINETGFWFQIPEFNLEEEE